MQIGWLMRRETVHPYDAKKRRVAKDYRSMSARLIISYDGTTNDDDALALGRMLAPAGFTLALAYVRHAREFDPSREEIAQHDAEQRLDRGAAFLGESGIDRHVVVGASTGDTLAQLAESQNANMILFGS